jgi:hypothetical protein
MFLELEQNGHKAAVKLRLKDDTGLWTSTGGLFQVLMHFFNGVFLLELLARFFAGGWRIIKSPSIAFDCIIVVTSSFDYIGIDGAKLNFLRMARMLKMLKVLKAFRAATALSELRIILKTVAESMKALFWSVLLLFSIMLFGSIMLAQLVSGAINEDGRDSELREWLFTYYGSGSRAWYTLFEATMSGGWPHYARRLVDEVSVGYFFFWVGYVCFVIFAVMRVLTAMFLQKTLKLASADEEVMVLEKMKEKEALIARITEYLTSSDADGNAVMERAECEAMVEQTEVNRWLLTLGLESHEVVGLFNVLDDGEGVGHEDFLKGIVRLSGGVRAMDSVMIMHEQRRVDRKIDLVRRQLDRLLQ